MRWEAIKKLSAEEFRRLTGVKKRRKEANICRGSNHEIKKKHVGGRQNKLGVEETLLMTSVKVMALVKDTLISLFGGLKIPLLKVSYLVCRDEKHY